MSPPLEQRTCPDCGAIFYLIAGVEAELPPHGCLKPGEQPQTSTAAAPQPPHEPTVAAAPGATPETRRPAGLFDDLQDKPVEIERPHPAPTADRGELREDTAKALREQGYVISEDAHGPRISGSPHGGPPGQGLSPSEVVRIAAELDGGVRQPTALQTCDKCQARTPAGEANCQWCGEPFSKSA